METYDINDPSKVHNRNGGMDIGLSNKDTSIETVDNEIGTELSGRKGDLVRESEDLEGSNKKNRVIEDITDKSKTFKLELTESMEDIDIKKQIRRRKYLETVMHFIICNKFYALQNSTNVKYLPIL